MKKPVFKATFNNNHNFINYWYLCDLFPPCTCFESSQHLARSYTTSEQFIY